MHAPLFGLENYLAQQDLEILIDNDNAMGAIAAWEQAANTRNLRNRRNPARQLVHALKAAGVATSLITSVYFAARKINTGQAPPVLEESKEDEFGTMDDDIPIEVEVTAAGDAEMATPVSNKRPATQGISPADRKPRKTAPDLEARLDVVDQNWDWEGTLNQQPDAMQDTEMQVARVGASGATMGATGTEANADMQTPVDIPTYIERLLFTPVVTAVLPLHFYFSMNKLATNVPRIAKIRLNHPYDIMGRTPLVVQNIVTAAVDGTDRRVERTKGISNDCCATKITHNAACVTNDQPYTSKTHSSEQNGRYLTSFPVSLIGATAATSTTSSYGAIANDQCKPAHIDWYAKQYEAMHTMETRYKITFYAGSFDDFLDNAVIIEAKNVITTKTGTTTNETREDSNLEKAIQFPNVKRHHLRTPSQHDQRLKKNTYTITGVWRPGQLADRSVVDDADIKRWYRVGTTAVVDTDPLWIEELVLLGYMDEYCDSKRTCLNVKVELEYVVQFKDLHKALLYQDVQDYSVPAKVTLSNNDLYQVPIGQEIVGSTYYPHQT